MKDVRVKGKIVDPITGNKLDSNGDTITIQDMVNLFKSKGIEIFHLTVNGTPKVIDIRG